MPLYPIGLIQKKKRKGALAYIKLKFNRDAKKEQRPTSNYVRREILKLWTARYEEEISEDVRKRWSRKRRKRREREEGG